MKSVSLNAFPRELSKRLGVKKVRTNGRIPAVIYGRHNKPQNLEVTSKELEQVIHTAHSEILLVNLAVDKNNRLALVREIQHHPLSGKMLHIDFQEVAENEKVTAMVPVETTGEAEGVKTGGGVVCGDPGGGAGGGACCAASVPARAADRATAYRRRRVMAIPLTLLTFRTYGFNSIAQLCPRCQRHYIY